ncbi:hypothetical protein SARC_14435, partial [Sphaeroforma arctica JP610]
RNPQTDGRLNSSASERSKLPDPGFLLSSADEEESIARVIDVEHSRRLPGMMIGSVFLAKPNNVVRHGYLSKLGIQHSDIDSIYSAGEYSENTSICSPSPSQPRSPYIYGSVSGS